MTSYPDNRSKTEAGNSDMREDTTQREPIGGLTCEQFQEQLAELLAAGGIAFSDHAHLQSCANCAALVRDLQYIAEAARQLLPAHDPSPALWSQIEHTLKLEAAAPIEPAASNGNAE